MESGVRKSPPPTLMCWSRWLYPSASCTPGATPPTHSSHSSLKPVPAPDTASDIPLYPRCATSKGPLPHPVCQLPSEVQDNQSWPQPLDLTLTLTSQCRDRLAFAAQRCYSVRPNPNPNPNPNQRLELIPGVLFGWSSMFHLRCNTSTYYHPTSTCRIGTCLDSKLKVHGVQGCAQG